MSRLPWMHFLLVAVVGCFIAELVSSSYVGASQRPTKTSSKDLTHGSDSERDEDVNTDEMSSNEFDKDTREKRPFGKVFGGSYNIGKRPFVFGDRYNFKKRSIPSHSSEVEDDIKMMLQEPLFAIDEDYKIEKPYGSPENTFHMKKRPFVLSGHGWRAGKRQYDQDLSKVDLAEEPFDGDLSEIDKRFVMRNGYPRLQTKVDSIVKRPFVSRSFKQFENDLDNNQELSKRPFVFSYGKRSALDDEIESMEVEKRPFVLGGGWKIGKRPFVMGSSFGKREDDIQKKPFVFGSGYRLGKRPFVLGNWGMLGQRNGGLEQELRMRKRPFVFGGGWRVGKRPFVFRSFGKRNPEEFDDFDSEDIDKRPFVFGSGYKFGKRPFVMGRVIGKRSMTSRDMLHFNKRPFVLGSGWRLGKRSYDFDNIGNYLEAFHNDMPVNKRPFNLGGFKFGKRLPMPDDTSAYPYISNENKLTKRPFVFGSRPYFGKRGFVFNKAYRLKRNYGDDLIDPAYDISDTLVKRPVFGSIYGGGFNLGKRQLDSDFNDGFSNNEDPMML